MVSLHLFTPAFARAQEQTEQTTKVNVQTAEVSDDPQAVVVSVRGECGYSEDGTSFNKLKSEHVLKEGALIRTGDGGQADIFFRRIGTTVRVQADTEIRLEKMDREVKNGSAKMETLLDLRKGRIFTAVRSFVPGSTLEIRNAAGRSVIEGGGKKGMYIITADGTQVTAKESDVPLKLVRETGVTIIEPGQQFRAKEGKLLPQDPPDAVRSMIEFDELHALNEKGSQTPATRKLSGNK